MDSQITIEPSVLEFKTPLTEQSTEYITITNNSDEPVAFKVKTTAPKYYCVRPNAALVPAGEKIQVQIILLGLAEEPKVDFKCKDKFLVITLPAPYDLNNTSVSEVWSQLEAEFKDQSISKKIKVKYVTSAATEQPQQEEQEQPQKEEPVLVTKEEPVVAEEVKQAEEVKEEKEEPVEEAKQAQETAQPVTKEDEQPVLVYGLFFLFAIVAIAWLYY